MNSSSSGNAREFRVKAASSGKVREFRVKAFLRKPHRFSRKAFTGRDTIHTVKKATGIARGTAAAFGGTVLWQCRLLLAFLTTMILGIGGEARLEGRIREAAGVKHQRRHLPKDTSVKPSDQTAGGGTSCGAHPRSGRRPERRASPRSLVALRHQRPCQLFQEEKLPGQRGNVR